MKNFPKTNHSKNSSREDKMRKDTVYVCVCAFLSANIREDRIRSRGEKKGKREKNRWLKSVCTGLQRASRRYRTTAEI